MSALVLDPAARPQGPRSHIVKPRRHLRLVTEGFVPEAGPASAGGGAGREAEARAPLPALRAVTASKAVPAQTRPALTARRPVAPRPGAKETGAQRVPGQSRPAWARGSKSALSGARSRPRAQEGSARDRQTCGSGVGASSLEPRLRATLRQLVRAGAAVVALVLAAAAATVVGVALQEPAPAGTTTAVVQSGQSLWDVAVATGADDVAEAVEQIYQLNDLQGSALQPGQVLVVPAS